MEQNQSVQSQTNQSNQVNQPTPPTQQNQPSANPKKFKVWMLILIIGVIVVVALAVALVFLQRQTANQVLNELSNQISNATANETANNTTKNAVNVVNTTNTATNETTTDTRTLLTLSNAKQYCDISNPALLEACGKEQFNGDKPTKTATYSNPAKGISFEVPYNSNWGSSRFKINPYDEIGDIVYFGPIGVGEGGGWARMQWELIFTPAKSADEVINDAKFQTDLNFFLQEPIKTTVNGLEVVKYAEEGLGTYYVMEVIGTKSNYHFNYWGSETDAAGSFATLENVVRSVKITD